MEFTIPTTLECDMTRKVSTSLIRRVTIYTRSHIDEEIELIIPYKGYGYLHEDHRSHQYSIVKCVGARVIFRMGDLEKFLCWVGQSLQYCGMCYLGGVINGIMAREHVGVFDEDVEPYKGGLKWVDT